MRLYYFSSFVTLEIQIVNRFLQLCDTITCSTEIARLHSCHSKHSLQIDSVSLIY